MMAGRLDDLACRYLLVADAALHVAGVAVFGAGRSFGIDGYAHMTEGADIVFRVGLAAGTCIGRIALLCAGRGGHFRNEVVGVCLALAAAGTDAVVIIVVVESINVVVGLGLAALTGLGREALFGAVRRGDNGASEGVNMLFHMNRRTGERVVVRCNAYLAPLHTVALIVYIREAGAVAERGIADGFKAQRQAHTLERSAARKC